MAGNYEDLENTISVVDKETFENLSPEKQQNFAQDSHTNILEGKQVDDYQRYAAIQYQKWLEKENVLQQNNGAPPTYEEAVSSSTQQHYPVFDFTDSSNKRPLEPNIVTGEIIYPDHTIQESPLSRVYSDPTPLYPQTQQNQDFYGIGAFFGCAIDLLQNQLSPLFLQPQTTISAQPVHQEKQSPLFTYFDNQGELQNIHIADEVSLNQAIDVLQNNLYSNDVDTNNLNLGSKQQVITSPTIDYPYKNVNGRGQLVMDDNLEGSKDGLISYLKGYGQEIGWQINEVKNNATPATDISTQDTVAATPATVAATPVDLELKDNTTTQNDNSVRSNNLDNNGDFLNKISTAISDGLSSLASQISKMIPCTSYSKASAVNLVEQSLGNNGPERAA